MRAAPLLILCLLHALAGYMSGRIVTGYRSLASAPMTLTYASLPSVPVVELTELRHGYFEGTVQGDVRFFAGNTQVLADENGAFRINAARFLVNNVDILVPAGMRFVASKRGTRYYPVLSAAGANIVPQNRIYFASEDEAKRAGYLPPR